MTWTRTPVGQAVPQPVQRTELAIVDIANLDHDDFSTVVDAIEATTSIRELKGGIPI